VNFERSSLNLNIFFSCKWDHPEIIYPDKCDLLIFPLAPARWLLTYRLWTLKRHPSTPVFWNAFRPGLKALFRYRRVEGSATGINLFVWGLKSVRKPESVNSKEDLKTRVRLLCNFRFKDLYYFKHFLRQCQHAISNTSYTKPSTCLVLLWIVLRRT